VYHGATIRWSLAVCGGPTLDGVRDRDTIDAELRLIAAVRRTIRENGVEPSIRHADELLDERMAVSRQAGGFEPPDG
jgi:hypothetical protein